MIKSYFLIGLRNILKNKLISMFNIFGLSLGIGFAIVVFIFIDFEYGVDRFHPHPERTFLVTRYVESNDSYENFGNVPSNLATTLEEEFPEVHLATRVTNKSAVIQAEDKDPFYDRVTFVDPAYLKIFNFPLKWGNSNSLKTPSSVVISSKAAEKYFGNENPVGQMLQLKFGNNVARSVTVGGVAEEFPLKRSFEFSFLINYEALSDITEDYQQWSHFADAVFITTNSATEIDNVAQKSEKFVTTYNQMFPESPIYALGYQELSGLALNTYKIRNDISQGYGPPAGKIALSAMALLLITLSCLNYINTATAMATSRLKEIGLRKVLGSKRKSIIFQFLVENLVLNFFALIVGILLARFIFLPGFDGLFAIGLTFDLSNPTIWIFFLSTLIISSILSGAYPAFYISKFQPNLILSGDHKLGAKNYFSRILLTAQFVFAFLYIVAGLLFIANENYQRNKDWGYNTGNLLVIEPQDQQALNYFIAETKTIPEVVDIAKADNHVGYGNGVVTATVDDEEMEVNLFSVDTAYLDLLQLKTIEGRTFQSRDQENIVINETFAKTVGWNNAIDKQVKIDSQKYYVSGVVSDFYHSSYQKEMEPIVFKLSPNARNYLVIRTRGNTDQQVFAKLKTIWNNVSPEIPFTGYYHSESFQQYFNLISGHSKVTVFSALLAVLLSCFGLFGLVYLHMMSRLKSYSMMKVLGISTFGLVKQVSKIFIRILIIAIIVGIPLSIFSTKAMFNIIYKDHIPITGIYPALASVLLVIISFGAISFLMYRLVKRNPVDALRSE